MAPIAGGSTPTKFGWRSGKPIRDPPVAGLAQTGSRCFSASATAASQPPAASMSGPATSTGARALEMRSASCGQRVLIRRGAAGDAPADGRGAAVLVGLRPPVVHRDRDERRPARRQRRVMDGPRQGAGDVLGPRRLVAPLDVRLRADDRVTVGQVGLDRDLRPDLLAGRDHQRRLVGLGVEDAADRVADAWGGVQVDVRRAAGGLGEAVGHPDDDQLLQAQDVGEILREVGQHRQLGRTRVAEDRRHPVGAEQLECGVTHARHQTSCSSSPVQTTGARRRRSRRVPLQPGQRLARHLHRPGQDPLPCSDP